MTLSTEFLPGLSRKTRYTLINWIHHCHPVKYWIPFGLTVSRVWLLHLKEFTCADASQAIFEPSPENWIWSNHRGGHAQLGWRTMYDKGEHSWWPLFAGSRDTWGYRSGLNSASLETGVVFALHYALVMVHAAIGLSLFRLLSEHPVAHHEQSLGCTYELRPGVTGCAWGVQWSVYSCSWNTWSAWLNCMSSHCEEWVWGVSWVSHWGVTGV